VGQGAGAVGSQVGEFVFFDCSKLSPAGRTSQCHDRAAQDSRKEHKTKSSVWMPASC
jgi:hypothetical protein